MQSRDVRESVFRLAGRRQSSNEFLQKEDSCVSLVFFGSFLSNIFMEVLDAHPRVFIYASQLVICNRWRLRRSFVAQVVAIAAKHLFLKSRASLYPWLTETLRSAIFVFQMIDFH
jgi:hypothetical protein